MPTTTYDQFIGKVQQHARLPSSGETVKAVRATLNTLGERLHGGEADNLAAQLPEEIGRYLTEAEGSEAFDIQQFYNRVSEREGVDLPDAIHHARVVASVLKSMVSAGEMADARAQLPDEYNDLFDTEEIEVEA